MINVFVSFEVKVLRRLNIDHIYGDEWSYNLRPRFPVSNLRLVDVILAFLSVARPDDDTLLEFAALLSPFFFPPAAASASSSFLSFSS